MSGNSQVDIKSLEEKAHHMHAPKRSTVRLMMLVGGVLFGIMLIYVIVHHYRVKHEIDESLKSSSTTTVEIFPAKRDTATHDLILPGNVQAFQQATLFARANGYIKAWYKDIGAPVKEGELIAEIEAPDVDAQMRQADANLAQARANLDIAKLNFEREKDLLQKKVISQQEFDTARTGMDAQEAAVKAGEANVQNLQAQQGFQKIVAPFSGIITNRYVDVGALVSIGNANSGTKLFDIAQTDPLRIYVYVPQSDATDIVEGMKTQLLVQEYPGSNFEATVARTAGAIDPTSRTLLTEVDIPNKDGKLYAGMYGQVKFQMKLADPPIIISANAFRFRTQGTQVAVIGQDNKVHWQTVKIGRDLGAKIVVDSGLEENTQVVMNPTDDLADGQQVQTKPYQEKTGAPQQGGKPDAKPAAK